MYGGHGEGECVWDGKGEGEVCGGERTFSNAEFQQKRSGRRRRSHWRLTGELKNRKKEDMKMSVVYEYSS